jgi:hypothetical protein
MMRQDDRVIVVGAGPVGAVTACPRGHGAMLVAGRDSCRGPRLCPPYKSFPHFSSIARASSKDSAEVGGNLSSQ